MELVMKHRRMLIILLLVVLMFIGLVVYASPYTRGTDQFWYVSDVESLIEGRGNSSNCYYPIPLMNNDSHDGAQFLHHTPILYMVSAFAVFVGSHHGWIFYNLLNAMLLPFACYLLLRDHIPRQFAIFGALLILIMPVVFWQTSNSLQEITFANLVAWLSVVGQRTENRPIVTIIISLLLILFHPIFVVISVMLLLRLAVVVRWDLLVKVIAIPVLMVCAYSIYRIKPLLMPTQGGFSLIEMLMQGSIRGNMQNYYILLPDTLDLSYVFEKMVNSLAQLVSISSTQIFYTPAVIVLLIAMYGLLAGYRPWKEPMSMIYIGAVIAWGMIILIHQNQFRYVLYFLPVAFVMAFIVIHRIMSRSLERINRWKTVILLALLLFIAVDVVVAMYLRTDALNDKQSITHARMILQPWQDRTRILYYSSDEVLRFCYALRPRPVLTAVVHDDAPNPDELSSRFKPELILIPTEKATVLNQLHSQVVDTVLVFPDSDSLLVAIPEQAEP